MIKIREREYKKAVRWQDGGYDVKRLCDDCHTLCQYPVHTDMYKEVYKEINTYKPPEDLSEGVVE